MKKGKSIALLSIISIIIAFLLVITFLSFPIGETKNFNSVLKAVELDYDLEGGMAYTLTLSEDNKEEVKDINEVVETIQKRMDKLGYGVYSVKALLSTEAGVEDYDIRIEAHADTSKYGKPDVDKLTSDIAATAAFGKIQLFGGTSANPTEEILTKQTVIKDAEYSGYDSNSGRYLIKITFTDYGYTELSKLINGSYYLSIKLGDTELLSGASAMSSLQGKEVYLTSPSEAAAKQGALQIATGGLAYKYDISDGVEISSPYGENIDTVCAIVIAGLVLVIIIALFVLGKGFGFISALSMLLFILIDLLMFIAVPSIRISLGGVIGIVFTTILTADGFIITLKRIKEEYAHGKTVKAAFNAGFRLALKPVLNCAVISAVTALVLFIFTSGALKGFAITLGIGTIVSVVSTLLFSRMFAGLILPLATNSEKFFNFKRDESAVKEAE